MSDYTASNDMTYTGKDLKGTSRAMHMGYSWESQKERDHLEKPRCRRVDNIKMHLRETVWCGVD
jgi:hypothetical protein